MKQSLISRGILVAIVVLAAILMAYPPSKKVTLGLDLQGGMHLVMQVKTDDAVRAEAGNDMDNLVSALKEMGMTGVASSRVGDSSADLTRFNLTGVPAARVSEARSKVSDYFGSRWTMTANGDGFLMAMDDGAKRDIRQQTVDQALRTVRKRIDEFGVSEPVIQRQGFSDSDRIVLQLPGVEDPERVKETIQKTAFLEYRMSVFPREGGMAASREEVIAGLGGQIPPDVEILEGDVKDVTGNTIGTQYVAVEKRAVVTGRDLKTARLGAGEFNEPVVQFKLDYAKGQDFSRVTGESIGRGMAVVLDRKVLTAPVIQGQIADEGVIKGSFDREEASDLAISLRSGALPAGLTILEERTVGPTLGQDSIDQGLRAGYYGAGLVVLAMLIVYLLSGLNAVLVLGLNVILVFGALAGFGATLTLPGIAGIILTIGMAVDANVLIFERIREELRAGKTVKAAIVAGFGGARSSIIDANITTLIAALFLFEFGTGPIRGFAVTLFVGILASLFTAVFVCRWLFDLWFARRQQVDRLSI
jgi:preprotein translocase subunit SecD